jgi:hypothetical protein
LHLIGERFDLIVEGGPRSQHGSARDTMGDDYHTTWHWFYAEGKVIDKEKGQESTFIIETRQDEIGYDAAATVETFLTYRITGMNVQWRESILPGTEPILNDFFATSLLAEIAAANKQSAIPRCALPPINYDQYRARHKEMVARGIIADENGQPSIPGLSKLSV